MLGTWECIDAGRVESGPVCDAVFSSDGSLFALAAGRHIVVLMSESNERYLELMCPEPAEKLLKLAFVTGSTLLVSGFGSMGPGQGRERGGV